MRCLAPCAACTTGKSCHGQAAHFNGKESNRAGTGSAKDLYQTLRLPGVQVMLSMQLTNGAIAGLKC